MGTIPIENPSVGKQLESLEWVWNRWKGKSSSALTHLSRRQRGREIIDSGGESATTDVKDFLWVSEGAPTLPLKPPVFFNKQIFYLEARQVLRCHSKISKCGHWVERFTFGFVVVVASRLQLDLFINLETNKHEDLKNRTFLRITSLNIIKMHFNEKRRRGGRGGWNGSH